MDYDIYKYLTNNDEREQALALAIKAEVDNIVQNSEFNMFVDFLKEYAEKHDIKEDAIEFDFDIYVTQVARARAERNL